MRAGGLEASAEPPLLARAPAALLLYLVLSLALQATSFGDTNRHADEMFYFLVGQRMHEGLLPYIDIWDRKPFGLFLTYYLIAGISSSVWSYQIAACLFVAATALAIGRLVQHWSGWRGGLLAGLAYVVIVQPFEGATGQAPDFYNLFVATAALLVVKDFDRIGAIIDPTWRGLLAMGLCGFAITVKQTALFESVFLGLCILVVQHRAGGSLGQIARTAVLCAAIGAAPTLLFALVYALMGYWPEYWQAMVLSNFAREPYSSDVLAWKAFGLVLRLAVLLPLAVWGILGAGDARQRWFLVCWILAGLVGFLSVPSFSVHYVLPLLTPLVVAAGLLLDRHRLRFVLCAALMLYALVWAPLDRREPTRASIAAMDEMAALVRRHDGGGGLLVFDGPSYLYATAGKRFLTPLAFPYHLNHQVENNVSHLDTRAEVDRVLAARPGVIVLSRWPRNHPVNAYTRARVLAYVRANCRFSKIVDLPEGPQVFEIVVRGDCAAR